MVRDRTIAHAIQQAYSVATIKERSPEVHLFIELPPDRVDVNVHPTKAEVRFLDQGLVHEVLRRAIVDALGADAARRSWCCAPRRAAVGGRAPAALPLGFGDRAPAAPATPVRGAGASAPARDGRDGDAGASRPIRASARDAPAARPSRR